MTWQQLALGDVALSIRNGLFARRPSDTPPGTRILRISAVRGGRVTFDDARFVDGLDESQMAKFAVEPGDLLMTRYNGSRDLVGSAGLVAEHDGPVIHPDKLIRIVLNREVAEPRFVNLQLQSPQIRRFLEPRIRTTAGQSGIAGGDVRQIPIVLPSLDEQRRTVAILEDHLSRLDAAEASLQSAERRIVALERSSLNAHFGCDGTDVPLRDIVLEIGAGKSFGGASAQAADDEWGIIKVSSMTWGTFRPEENKAIEADRADPRYEVREGDLLVSRANTSEYVGASVLVGPVRRRLLLSDKSLRVVPAPGVQSAWLWRALQAPTARRQISALATGTKDSMRNISQASLRKVRIPDPAQTDQRAALEAFEVVATACAETRRELERQRLRADVLRRALLSAAFSGRLTSTRFQPPGGVL